jgi:cysteinyl-tRNA synthetase
MHALTLHNGLTRWKEQFTPLDPNHVRMYVCGPRAMLVGRPSRLSRS